MLWELNAVIHVKWLAQIDWHRESTQKMVASVAIKEDAGHVVETEGPSWEVHRAEDCLSWLWTYPAVLGSAGEE